MYAVLCGLLLVALIVLNGKRVVVQVPATTSASPWAGMIVPGTDRHVPAHLHVIPGHIPVAPVPRAVAQFAASIGLTAPLPPVTIPTPVYVGGVTMTTGQDISDTINALSIKFGVPAIDIAAVVMTESDFNPYAERWAGGLDNSCGLMQQIIVNVTALTGITDARAACNWEEVPYNSLWYGTLILAQDQQAHPAVPWPWAYCFYNAGNGQTDSFCLNPYGQAYTNIEYNFIPKWYYVQDHFSRVGPTPTPRPRPHPKPVPFPLQSWCHYAKSHGKPCPSPYWHHRLGTVAQSWLYGKTIRHNCAGVRGPEKWLWRQRVMRTDFAHCVAYSWPTKRTSAVKWTKR